MDLALGDIDGVPRLIDLGQCGDVYSAVSVAAALAKALDKPIEDLPMSFVLSWHGQRALAGLMALMSFGFKNLRLGPTRPAFFGAETMAMLEDRCGLKDVAAPEDDLAAILGQGRAMEPGGQALAAVLGERRDLLEGAGDIDDRALALGGVLADSAPGRLFGG
jgi:hydroxylamine reductase (hybrid-cluster protein)